MLRFLNIVSGDATQGGGTKVFGKAPFIFLGRPLERRWDLSGAWRGAARIAYHDSQSPIEYECWIKSGIADFIESNSSDDFVWSYSDEHLSFADYKSIKVLYDEQMKRQVDKILSTLDWSKVKNDQKADFFKGLRTFSVSPPVALQICLSCYNFDDWQINWGDPRTYWNGLKEIISVAKSVAP